MSLLWNHARLIIYGLLACLAWCASYWSHKHSLRSNKSLFRLLRKPCFWISETDAFIFRWLCSKVRRMRPQDEQQLVVTLEAQRVTEGSNPASRRPRSWINLHWVEPYTCLKPVIGDTKLKAVHWNMLSLQKAVGICKSSRKPYHRAQQIAFGRL